jgi:excinuclease ABC subunit B
MRGVSDRAFQLVSPFEPCGDQPAAIDALVRGLEAGEKHQVLLGATGTGKTYAIAHVIARSQRPTLVLAPNKTLAAQLYSEFREFFPHNAVEYFVSYYDYYQPEAYIPASDTYIEKDSLINDAIDRMRHAATRAVLERRDVIIVASVSCIYGIGDKQSYKGMLIPLARGQEVRRDRLLRKLVDIQYARNDYDFHRSTFRVRGDIVEIFPAYEENRAIRLSFWGDEIEAIQIVDPLRGQVFEEVGEIAIFPGSHYVTPAEQLKAAIASIRGELAERLAALRAGRKDLEAQRLAQRTHYDLEMLEQVGFCQGIENYSRHLTGRAPGEPPPVLLDYFPDDYLMVIDESHVAIPQAGGMFRGDRARKQTLVDYGFRLPSAVDNRPLTFEELEARVRQVICLSATPGPYEMDACQGSVVEQLIRPTGLVDPKIEVRSARGQVDDLLDLCRQRAKAGERVLVTTLTKRMAEDLTEYYQELGVRVRYLHSDIDTLERVRLLDALRRGEFDVLVGINLLREGLDLPEVSLVAVLDADKEGFLRSERSLIQTIGRAARHLNGTVVLYADQVTNSMRRALDETDRRRALQNAYNELHGITPRPIHRPLRQAMQAEAPSPGRAGAPGTLGAEADPAELAQQIERLRKEMSKAARELDFEKAAELRDRVRAYQAMALGLGAE